MVKEEGLKLMEHLSKGLLIIFKEIKESLENPPFKHTELDWKYSPGIGDKGKFYINIDDVEKLVAQAVSQILRLIDDELTDLQLKTLGEGIAIKQGDLWETKNFLLDKVRKALLEGSSSLSIDLYVMRYAYDCLDCHAHVESPIPQFRDRVAETCTACGSTNIKKTKPRKEGSSVDAEKEAKQ